MHSTPAALGERAVRDRTRISLTHRYHQLICRPRGFCAPDLTVGIGRAVDRACSLASARQRPSCTVLASLQQVNGTDGVVICGARMSGASHIESGRPQLSLHAHGAEVQQRQAVVLGRGKEQPFHVRGRQASHQLQEEDEEGEERRLWGGGVCERHKHSLPAHTHFSGFRY